MASFSVRKGVSAAARLLPGHGLIVAGLNRHLKAASFDDLLSQKLDGEVSQESWQRALQLLPSSGSCPLLFNLAKIISLPDASSRHNTPSNSHILSRELRSAGLSSDLSALHIILLTEYEHALAIVAAVARAFPLFSRKTKQSALKDVHLELVFTDREESSVPEEDVNVLAAVAENIRTAQRLVDTPANEMTTDALVAEALAIAEQIGAKAFHIKGEELLEKGFGGIYHVGKAALTPPAFVVLSHEPEDATSTYALVGKGIVYDTGGMQIKGKTAMPSMKGDMGGAASLLAAFASLVRGGFSQRLHACLCIAENNISPVANKPDDVIRLLSGKTCEITNTDAEGRLVLADGVYYAKHTLNATFILDMATLTGAQSQMTGKFHAALLTNSDIYEQKGAAAGRFSGDLLHPMVFAPDMHWGDMSSPIADMKNSQLGKMVAPPSCLAGLFIGAQINFGEGLDWLHVDMAAPCTADDRATGYGVALVTALLGEHTNSPLLHQALKNFFKR